MQDLTVIGDEGTFAGSCDVLFASADGEQQVLWLTSWLASQTLMTPALGQEVLLRIMADVDALKDFNPFPDSG